MIVKKPTHTDVPYGPHERNVLDLHQAKSEAPAPLYVFIHGGGFMAGDKGGLDPLLLEDCLDAGISVAAINYRLSGTDAYPAAMRDGARAVQFLRHKAEEWNLDPARFAAGGGSAGGGIAFWVGFREDMADPASDDPVARLSTRLVCIASWDTQSSYDPNFLRTLISGPAHRHEALQQFFRVGPEEFETPRARKMFEEASALNYVSPEVPPVFVWYSRPNLPMTPDLPADHGIHHPRFGHILKERMDKAGVECVVRCLEDYPEVAALHISGRFREDLVGFLKRHFGMGEGAQV